MDLLGGAGDGSREVEPISGDIGRCHIAAAEVEIVVLELRRPAVLQGIFKAAADGPSCRIKAAAAREDLFWIVSENHVDRAVRPGGAAFGVKQRRADCVAEAAGQRGIEIRTDAAGAADVDTREGEAGVGPVGNGPAHVAFDPEYHTAQLIVIADLTAADESGASYIVAVDGWTKRVGNV